VRKIKLNKVIKTKRDEERRRKRREEEGRGKEMK
jgi:hypothetical protein